MFPSFMLLEHVVNLHWTVLSVDSETRKQGLKTSEAEDARQASTTSFQQDAEYF